MTLSEQYHTIRSLEDEIANQRDYARVLHEELQQKERDVLAWRAVANNLAAILELNELDGIGALKRQTLAHGVPTEAP